jgi:hypothetical protein
MVLAALWRKVLTSLRKPTQPIVLSEHNSFMASQQS